MIDYTSSPEELLLMIGDREFQHYKAKRRVEQLEQEIEQLKKENEELRGRLESTHHYLELLDGCSADSEGTGLRRGESIPECSDESSNRDDSLRQSVKQVPGV